MRSEDHKHTSASLRLSFKVGGDQEAKMAAKEQTRLAVELDFCAAHKADRLEEHSEKYAVVQDRNVLGFYPSFEDAFRAGAGAFGVTRDFLVTQVLEHAGFPHLLD